MLVVVKILLTHLCTVGCRPGTHTWLGSLCLLVGGPPLGCRLIREGGITGGSSSLLLRQVRTNSPPDTWKIKGKKVTTQVSFTQRGDNIKNIRGTGDSGLPLVLLEEASIFIFGKLVFLLWKISSIHKSRENNIPITQVQQL